MAQTTFVNSKGIAHKGSGGESTTFPDVCKTPPTGAPTPYPNIGKAANAENGPVTVITDGEMPMTKGAQYSMSEGDEAGSMGGVVSGSISDVCEFANYSFDVKFEGQNVCRLGDPLFQNAKNIQG